MTDPMKHALLFLFILSLVLSCSRCKEQECTDSTNPDCPNYVAPTPVDPCASSHEVSADFSIEMDVWISGPPEMPLWAASNHCVAGVNDVKLHAYLDNAISYKWIVGIDTISTQDYIFSISNQYAGQTIWIKLIVTGTPDTICFPNDNGIDTISKQIHVVDFCDSHIFGKYKGAWQSAPLDSFEVKLAHEDCINPNAQFADYLVNIDQTGDSCGIDWAHFGDTLVTFTSQDIACSSARGAAHLFSDLNHIEINYRISDGTHPFESELWPVRIFNGRRIQ
jgi:hypothetical protein